MSTSTTGLSAGQRALLPGSEDRTFYREHGYWISPKIIPTEVLDAAERGMERFYAGDWDADGTGPGGRDARPQLVRGRGEVWGDGIRKSDYASRVVRELADLVAYPMIGATAAALSGGRRHPAVARPAALQAGRPAGCGRQRGLAHRPPVLAGLQLARHAHRLGRVPRRRPGRRVGGFLDGSHRWDVTGLDFFSQDLTGLEESVRAQGFSPDRVPVTMARGQVSFHHCRTVHGSGPNRRDAPRRSLAIHLQPADNHFSGERDAEEKLCWHGNADRCRHVDGVPDFADERVCPTLWSR